MRENQQAPFAWEERIQVGMDVGIRHWEVDKTHAVGKQQDCRGSVEFLCHGWIALKVTELMINCWDLSLIRSRSGTSLGRKDDVKCLKSPLDT